MGHARVVEVPQDVQQGVHLTHLAQVVTAQALALAGTARQRHEVDELDGGGGELLGLEERRQIVQARVGDLHDGHVRLLGALVPDVRAAGLAEQVEQRGLSCGGQTNDSDAHDPRIPLDGWLWQRHRWAIAAQTLAVTDEEAANVSAKDTRDADMQPRMRRSRMQGTVTLTRRAGVQHSAGSGGTPTEALVCGKGPMAPSEHLWVAFRSPHVILTGSRPGPVTVTAPRRGGSEDEGVSGHRDRAPAGP